jgi:hypothetical protein
MRIIWLQSWRNPQLTRVSATWVHLVQSSKAWVGWVTWVFTVASFNLVPHWVSSYNTVNEAILSEFAPTCNLASETGQGEGLSPKVRNLRFDTLFRRGRTLDGILRGASFVLKVLSTIVKKERALPTAPPTQYLVRRTTSTTECKPFSWRF